MYVTAKHNDSQITSKYQIWVKIVKHSDKKNNTASSNQQNFAKSQINFPGYKIPPSELPWRKPMTKLNNVNGTSSSSTSDPPVKSTSTSPKSESSSHTPEDTTRSRTEDDESTSKSSANISKTVEPELISHEPSGKLIIALIPTIVIFVSLFVSAIVACLFRKKICKKRNKIKKDDMVRNQYLDT